ncbi:hypothetical protein LTR22_007576 [Elasticomyces elasticus]|nr:hypothetical protein LTR22_007576 [Elasticomyces elasticus]KAK5765398.1 hypothetical protein LTS12_004411 [Elasticomyces elasticus]
MSSTDMNTTATTPFRQIGKGFCGSVWAPDRPGPASAMKREDGGPLRSVAKDSTRHITIERSLKDAQGRLNLAQRLNMPQHRELIRGDDSEWWRLRSARFPPTYQPCNTLITERILPLERSARDKLVDLFCPARSRATIKTSRKDEDCLIRPYLGRRRANFCCPSPFFTLRNKPLLVHQLDGMGLPIDEYAGVMADTIAILYWHARSDANDVEFVLAPPRSGEEEDAFQSEVLGIEQAARAFFRNDPFYPRPDWEHETDRRLWEVFSRRFLESSTVILGDARLARIMLDRLEELGEERRQNRLDLQAVDEMEKLAV